MIADIINHYRRQEHEDKYTPLHFSIVIVFQFVIVQKNIFYN